MKKVRILIVEDEAIIAMEIENQLQNLEYKVTSIVDTSEKAIEKAEADKPDIILTDISINGKLNGIETAGIIRSRFNIPIIYLTGYSDDERLKRAQLTLPFSYLLKPVQTNDLKVAIEMALYAAKIESDREQVEVALQQSEKKYRTLAENLPDIISRYDRKGCHVYVSENITHLSGKKANDFIGKTHSELGYSENQAKQLDEQIQKLFKTGHPQELNFFLNSVQGLRYLNWRLIPEYDREGEIEHTLGITRDITDHEQAEIAVLESGRKYQDLYDNAPDMYVSVDAKTSSVIECNQTLINTTGYTKNEIIGKDVFNLYTPKSASFAKANIFPEFVKTGIVDKEELQLQRKDGSVIDVSLSVSAFRDPEGNILHSRSSWRGPIISLLYPFVRP